MQHPVRVLLIAGRLYQHAPGDTGLYTLFVQLFQGIVTVKDRRIAFQPGIFRLTEIPDVDMCINHFHIRLLWSKAIKLTHVDAMPNPNCPSINSLCSPSPGAPLSETAIFPSIRMGHRVVLTESPLLVLTFNSISSTL